VFCAIDLFALSVDRAALFDDRSLSPSPTDRAARSVDVSTNGCGLATDTQRCAVDRYYHADIRNSVCSAAVLD